MTNCTPQPSESSSVPSSSTISADNWSLEAYDYELPPEKIAQNPVDPRDASQLLAVTSDTQHQHRYFRDLPSLLQPGDLLVLNDTRVIPARLYGYKPGGARVEILLLEEQSSHRWLALVKPGKRLKPGAQILFSKEMGDRPDSQLPITGEREGEVGDQAESSVVLKATVVAVDEATGGRILQFELPSQQSLLSLVEELGQVPLPPYITQSQALPEQYQTVYAHRPGAIAAPTAGLHFTPNLFDRLEQQGIRRAFITLHVGVGTFRPVEVEDITTHKMHGEWLEVSPETVAQIRETQARGGRIIAVGTTVTRALETAGQSGTIQPYCGKSELFIYPGYQWQVVEGLITNFHLPKSSLMMLVSALVGRQRLLDLYQEAIAHDYRFYSFGDAMLILPEARC